MQPDIKQKLVQLGPEVLADKLIALALYSDTAREVVERLVASTDEVIQQIKDKFDYLRNRLDFVDWRSATAFSHELDILLTDIEHHIDDPVLGLELVTEFIETDSFVQNRCDDSSGEIGTVYSCQGVELFAHFAEKHPDKEHVARILVKLNQCDDFGVRSELIENCASYLPTHLLWSMVNQFKLDALQQSCEYKISHFYRSIESLAKQMNEPELFEEVRLKSSHNSSSSFIDIAEVYLKAGQVETAYDRLQKAPERENFRSADRERLLLEIYRKQGNHDQLSQLLYQQFQKSPSLDSLHQLLSVIGKDKKSEVIEKQLQWILDYPKLDFAHVHFLIAINKLNEAEQYLLKRYAQITSQAYYGVLSLAQEFESRHLLLVATLLYRTLLCDILDRAYSKAYNYASGYLKKLDKLAPQITDWLQFENHHLFKAKISEKHSKKRSFWSTYGK